MNNVELIGAIVIALTTLAAFVAVVIKVVHAVSKPTADLSVAVGELNITLKGIQDDNKEHKRQNEKQHDEFKKRLDNHHDRLLVIETEHKNNHDDFK